ncbi:MAG: hypothetical protein JO112_23005, partial [Planctomycetes bacterium]|nr:hypothetical protein [Planctomycetota bacterium]
PLSGWSPHALGVGVINAVDIPWILWDNSNGAAALWQLTANYALSHAAAYGPFSGFTALDVTVGVDGNPRLLWDRTDGTTVLWTVSSTTLVLTVSQSYGPFSGFTAVALEAGRDGLTRLAWSNSGGAQEVWLVNLDDTFHSAGAFGPF